MRKSKEKFPYHTLDLVDWIKNNFFECKLYEEYSVDILGNIVLQRFIMVRETENPKRYLYINISTSDFGAKRLIIDYFINKFYLWKPSKNNPSECKILGRNLTKKQIESIGKIETT